MAQHEYDKLGGGLPYEEYLAQVGAYQSARRTVELVDQLITKAEEYRDRTESAEQHNREHTRAITFGSYLWPGK